LVCNVSEFSLKRRALLVTRIACGLPSDDYGFAECA
jgi:hypothetical protein